MKLNTIKLAAPMMALAVSVQMFGAGSAFAASFTDTNNHWAQTNINVLSDANVIGGYQDGSFKPEGLITRAEFATILSKALRLNSESSYSGFSDVSNGFWATPHINAVKNAGLISGYPGNQFKPNKYITRAEVMTILSSADRTALPANFSADHILSQHPDGSQVPNWARESVAEAAYTHVMKNEPSRANYIDANDLATRGEVAAMIYSMGNNMPNLAFNESSNTQMGTNNNNNNNGTNTNALQARIVTVPATTEFSATLETAIHSELSREGDQVVAVIAQPLLSLDKTAVVVPSGSKMIGKVMMIQDAGRLGKDAKMRIEFSELVLPNGEKTTLSARIATEDGLLKGGTTKGRVGEAAVRTAVGAGLGAAVGTAMGPLSGGKVGKGAIYGTAVGAGLGAASAGIDKGSDVIVKTGEQLKIQLTQPITLTANQSSTVQ